MTTKEIQMLIGKEQIMKGHNPVAENAHILFSEHDVISMSKSGYLYEFEVKISRGDFRADQKKQLKHQYYSLVIESGCPNYFYYVCPEGLIKPHELPSYAGLIYVRDEVIEEIKPAPRLHKHKHDKGKILEKICRMLSERHFLGSTKLTYLNKQIRQQRLERESRRLESKKPGGSLF